MILLKLLGLPFRLVWACVAWPFRVLAFPLNWLGTMFSGSCRACGTFIGGRKKAYYWTIGGKMMKVCSSCNRTIERKKSSIGLAALADEFARKGSL